MSYCPRCKKDFEGDLASCPNCGLDLNNPSEDVEWVPIAKIYNKISADFVKETLDSQGIPNTVISESGFFGQAGLNLPSLSGKGLGKFRLHVPKNFVDDTLEVLDMTIGDDWEKIEN
ncbi:MAG: hypothetical protein ABIJ45_11600 [Candidatus Zixiibacteriota bacterium]